MKAKKKKPAAPTPPPLPVKTTKGDITQLISKGRKQGYLLFDEIDKTFQDELEHEGSFDDFISSIDDYGIKILDQKQKEIAPKRRKSELLTLQGLERTTDPVKLYLREMGNISLLTREGEIAIAREIERGEKSIIKALSKTRLVLNEVLGIEDKIKDEPLIIQEMFDVSEDDIAEGKLEEKKKQILAKIKKIKDLSRKLDRIPRDPENRPEAEPDHRPDEQPDPRPQPPLGPAGEDHRDPAGAPPGDQRPGGAQGGPRADPGQDAEEEGLRGPPGQAPRGRAGAPGAPESHRPRRGQSLRKTVRSITTGKKISDQAKKELVAANLRLVVSIAKKYRNRGLSSWTSSRKATWA